MDGCEILHQLGWLKPFAEGRRRSISTVTGQPWLTVPLDRATVTRPTGQPEGATGPRLTGNRNGQPGHGQPANRATGTGNWNGQTTTNTTLHCTHFHYNYNYITVTTTTTSTTFYSYNGKHNYNYITLELTTLRCLQPLVGPSVGSLCHLSFTATNPSKRFLSLNFRHRLVR